MGTTQIGGEQINRRWAIVTSLALGLTVYGTAATLNRPAYRVEHPSGGVSHEVRLNGQQYQTGSLTINLGGLTGTGTIADPGVALEVINGILSGATIHASGNIRASGSLMVESSISGATLAGFGLIDCDTAGSSKLLWDNTTKKFSCGTDQGATYTAGQGLTLTSTSFKVNATVTGSLIRFTNISGSTIFALNGLSSSGGFVMEGTMSGHTVDVTTVSGGIIRGPLASRWLGAKIGTGATLATGSGKLMISVLPDTMSGMVIVSAQASVMTAGTTNSTCFQVRNASKGNRKIFSTPVCIPTGQKGNDATFVINSANRDVGSNDQLIMDITGISTTVPKPDLDFKLGFSKL